MTDVQLLIDDEANREALRTLVERRYTVVTGDGLLDADAHVVDDQTLPRYRDALRAHDRATEPVFSPTVLVRREGTRIDVDLPSLDRERGPTTVDEIVTAPVDPEEFFRRLENLLARREQSIALTRRYEHTEARFEGLFDAVPDPAVVLDSDGVIAEVNDAFVATTGVAYADAVGRRPGDLDVFGADALARFPAPRGDADGDGDGGRDDGDGGRDDGDATTAERVESDADSDVVAYTTAAGEERYAELRVRERTVEGESVAIVVMHDVTALREQNERLEAFASIVTHDVRSPLQVATGRLPMVADGLPEDDGGAHDHLDVVGDALDRIDVLIDGVRTLVRETDVEEREPVVLGDVVRAAWQNVESDVDAPETDGGERALDADPERLQELLENLFRNAHDHADGEVRVRVGTTDDGFYVADDGPGIPPDERSKVLETGYTTASDGTGLGLAIVSSVADAHGWTVSVGEGEWGGARFDVSGVAFADGDACPTETCSQ